MGCVAEFGVNVLLIGFMGSGKSTVAQALSFLLGFTLVEMDELVCQRVGVQTMHEVFALGGERLLRETEIALAKEYGAKTDQVISAGGGVVSSPTIFDFFKEAKVIFLQASFETIQKRLEGDKTRPLFTDDARKLYDFRLPLYLRYADEIIDVDAQSAEEIALKIKNGL